MTNDAWDKLFESPAYIYFGWFALQIFVGWVLADISRFTRLTLWTKILAWPFAFVVFSATYLSLVGTTISVFMTLNPSASWNVVQEDPFGFLEFALNVGAEFSGLVLLGALAWLIMQAIKLLRLRRIPE